MPTICNAIVAISIVFRSGDQCCVWSLGDEDATERDILQHFYDGLDRYTPILVSWNGGGFDLPVIHYRTLLHGIAAPRYWEVGEDDRAFRFDNYLNRFQWRHTDLLDTKRGRAAPLDEIATLMGVPGKMGMSGAKVWDVFMGGDISGMRNYCETDVLNTWLAYLGFEKMRGRLTETAHEKECQLLRDTLVASDKSHLIEFESAWYPSEP